jgi:hypothetical protein
MLVALCHLDCKYALTVYLDVFINVTHMLYLSYMRHVRVTVSTHM